VSGPTLLLALLLPLPPVSGAAVGIDVGGSDYAPAERGPVIQATPTDPPPPQPDPWPDLPGTPSDATWDRVARCESNGNWAISTGNGYSGGLQFSLASWRAVGGTGYPHHASRDEQIHRADRLWLIQGWPAWPACSRKLGLR
jgi:hypothetical protein